MSIGLAVIGCGNVAKMHLQEIDYRVRLEIACSRRSSKASEYAANFGFRKHTNTLNDILIDKNVDAVIICTPNESHHKIAKKCLMANKHILIEKPFTNYLSHAKELIDIAEEKNRIIMVGHILRHFEVFRRAKEIIHTIGKPIMATDTRIGFKKPKKWWLEEERFLLLFQGTHSFDILCWLVSSRPKKLLASTDSIRKEFIGEDTFSACLLYDNFRANINHSFSSSHKKNEIIIIGSKKTIRIVDYEKLYIDDKLILHDRSCVSHPFTSQMQEFVDSLINGREPTSSGKDALVSQQIIESCYLSKGKLIEVKK